MPQSADHRSPAMSCFVGAIAGLVAAPIGGVVWVLPQVVASRPDFELNLTWSVSSALGLAIYFGIVGLVALFVAGPPGALLGAVLGVIIGNRRPTIFLCAFVAALGAALGLLLGAVPQVGLADLDRFAYLTLGSSGAIAASIALVIFDRLGHLRRS